MPPLNGQSALSRRTLRKVLLVLVAGMAFLLFQLCFDGNGRGGFGGGRDRPQPFTPATAEETRAAAESIRRWMAATIPDPGARIIDPGILYRLPDGQGYMITIRIERGEGGPAGQTVQQQQQQWSLTLRADGTVRQADLFRAPESRTAIPMH